MTEATRRPRRDAIVGKPIGAIVSCECATCLCWVGTRHPTKLCRSCRDDQHPGDPRPR